MTPNLSTLIQPAPFLIMSAPDSEFHHFLSQAYELAQREPQLLDQIDQDLQKEARRKKHKRLTDQQWKADQNTFLPYSLENDDFEAETLILQKGRPRMPPLLVYFFIMIRGYLGGIKSQSSQRFLQESMTLHLFLSSHDLKMPGMSTILDNINPIEQATLQTLFDAQIHMIIHEELDDFDSLKLDSTAVEANSSFPVDSIILTRLVERIFHQGRSLDKFDSLPIHETRCSSF